MTQRRYGKSATEAPVAALQDVRLQAPHELPALMTVGLPYAALWAYDNPPEGIYSKYSQAFKMVQVRHTADLQC